MTVFFSSHQIAEVDQIADRVAIIDRGRTVVAGALDDSARGLSAASNSCSTATRPSMAFRAPGVVRARRKGRVLTVTVAAPARSALLDEARALGPVSVDVVPVTLKEIFLETVSAED